MEITSTKISGLAVDTEYTFYLVLKTSAGTYHSEKLAVRTHKMTELSGITVTPGILPAPLRQSLSGAVDRIGAKIAENVRIDTTHFVCTEGRGREWEKAAEMNIPVVRPEWIEGCEREGRIVGVRGYYLNADPRLRQVGQGVGAQNQQQQSPQPSRTDSQATLPYRPQQQNPSQQNSVSSNALDTSRAPQPSPSPTDPAPTPPAKDTPAPEKRSEPNSPSTVQSADSNSRRNPEVSITSPSEPDHEKTTPDENAQRGQDDKPEPKSPGDSSFTDITL